jgi:hypothetical protein
MVPLRRASAAAFFHMFAVAFGHVILRNPRQCLDQAGKTIFGFKSI